MKQLLLETDKRENQGMPKVRACSVSRDCGRSWMKMPLTLPQVSCSPSDGLSTHLAYGEAQSLRLTVFPTLQLSALYSGSLLTYA
jgi:hypothetical protein